MSHGFLDACRDRGVRFVVRHQLTADIAAVCATLPDQRWQPAVTADGADERDCGEVAEITGLVDLPAWPPGTPMIARREDPHPGAQLTFTDIDGHRFQVFICDLDDPHIAYLEALYRGRGRAERHICDTKDTGMNNLPSASFAINQACSPSSASPKTSSPGLDASPSPATSHEPNPNDSATTSSTSPANSPATHAAPDSAPPRTGPGALHLALALDRLTTIPLRT
jgi:hypothetical protein